MHMKNNVYRTSLGGLLSAFSIAIMLFGSLIPFATYVVPVISSITIVYFCIEYSKKHALTVYIVIGLLSMFFVPDKEIAFMFVFIFGPYPMLKSIYEVGRAKVICWIMKLTTFNLQVLLSYFLLLKVFISPVLVMEFSGYGSAMIAVILVVANLTFIIYDNALTKLISIYLLRIRPRLFKKR